MELADGNIWFIFGKDTDGIHVDIADSENETLVARVPYILAEEICEKHNAAVWAIQKKANMLRPAH